MEYIVDDHELNAEIFISLANNIQSGKYDFEKTQKALQKNQYYSI